MIKKIPEVIQPHHIKFLVVGALGFTINFFLLFILHSKLHMSLLISQLVAAEAGALSNFYWHNRWTYKDRAKASLIKRLIQFHATAWVGAGIATVTLLLLANVFHINYLIALVMGSALALIWNYSWSNFVIWRSKQASA